ncbi:MAG TPA: O-antigen ligase family protein [Anaerolineales bacterium]|nr:O-antigen ligase family protein [Anaerolineales bacterium]
MNYHSIQGAWKGVYWHKNHLGLIATFINILFLINIIDSWKSQKKHLFIWVPLYFCALLFVYKSGSVAAYLTTLCLHGLILLALAWLKFRQKLHRFHYLLFALVLLIAGFSLYFGADRFLAIFNRNESLTGRVPMWTYLFNTYISKRLFGGYGFNAFWYIYSHRVAMGLAAGYPDPIVIADNGFIDILVNTGLGGFLLFLVYYLGAWWHSIRQAGKAKDITGIFPLVLMSFTLLANISWSLIFENQSFFTLIIVSILFCISGNSLMDRSGQ